MTPRSSFRWHNLPVPEPHLVAIALGVALQRRHPWTRRRRPVAGWALIGAGLALAVAATAAAGHDSLTQPDRLVVDGPYKLSRNPMYLGWALIHLGAAQVTGSGWLLVGLPAAAAGMHRRVLGEEWALARTFGEEFEAYRTTVRRYV